MKSINHTLRFKRDYHHVVNRFHFVPYPVYRKDSYRGMPATFFVTMHRTRRDFNVADSITVASFVCLPQPLCTVQGRLESHPSSFIAGIVPCEVFVARTQPNGEMLPQDSTPVVHGGMQERLGAPTAPATMPSAYKPSKLVAFDLN